MINYQEEELLILIARKLEGIATASEDSELNEWINASSENRKYFEEVSNIWDGSDRLIRPESINSNDALARVLKKISFRKRRNAFWFYWQRVAAIIIIPVIIGSYLMLRSSNRSFLLNDIVYNEVYAAYGTRSSLRLADSTLVWLNSGSSLKYPSRFDGRSRRVILRGEAYFEVSSDDSKPFVVETSAMDVRATGTRFSVRHYDSEKSVEVTLTEGKVNLFKHGMRRDAGLISVLEPDQHIVYTPDSEEKQILNGDTYKYIAWKDGKLIFRNDPLEDVLTKIGISFNCDIEIMDKQLKEYSYHATFQDESLDEILKLLEMSAPITYIELPRLPLRDGTFSRKRVEIFAKE